MMVIGEAIMMVTEAVSGAVTAEIIDKQAGFKAALASSKLGQPSILSCAADWIWKMTSDFCELLQFFTLPESG
ncbi:hypothetical protein [Sideroxydans sp. CL21]|uniref:hypothetical protein n=1 Tax=Sideroxydans sp. CL21 TaxID=2600596 RepID=UPI0024BC6233|nr:hypothetical protein [Sideroxydans sp. CL21]